ncbi:MAG: helix-turn-helix domain-containing protein [Bacteroidetes bacterium]|nr:helix-turn-helix domain-containing protein [Bacteroidota bacterium]
MRNKLSIGEKLKQVRVHNELSQKQFAELIGIKPPYLSELENNKKEITSKLLIALSEKFSLSIDWLLFDDMSFSNFHHSKGNRFSTPRDNEKIGNQPDRTTDQFYITSDDIYSRINVNFHRLENLYQRIIDVKLMHDRIVHGKEKESIYLGNFMDGLAELKGKYFNDMLGLNSESITTWGQFSEIENLNQMNSQELYDYLTKLEKAYSTFYEIFFSLFHEFYKYYREFK